MSLLWYEPSCTRKQGYKLSLSQCPLRLARQWAFMDIVVVIISVSRDPEAVMLRKSDPPLEGGVDCDGKAEAT